MAAQVETRKSQPPALDTGKLESDRSRESDSPATETAEKTRPASGLLEVPISPIDSGSEYSQADSRPVSLMPEDDLLSAGIPAEDERRQSDSAEGSRPVTARSVVLDTEEEDTTESKGSEGVDGNEPQLRLDTGMQYATLAPPSDHLAPPISPTLSTYSGSDYSQDDSEPNSPVEASAFTTGPQGQEMRKSRPTSIMVQKRASASEFADEPLHTPNVETRSQPPISPESGRSSRADEDVQQAEKTSDAVKNQSGAAPVTAKRASQATLNYGVVQSPSPYDDVSPWESQQARVPAVKTSAATRSSRDSNYFGSPAQSPQTPKMPISPMTPDDAHMSINDMESVRLSDSSLDYDHLSSEQVNDALATPRARGNGHIRKPSSLEILQNNFMLQRQTLQRQTTFFDVTKDEPLATPTYDPSDDDFGAHFEMAQTVAYASHASTPSVTVVDTTSGRSSLATATRRSSSSGEDEVEVDWYALDKTEEQEKEDKELPEGAEDETTAFLLARLEQENAKFSADPKSSMVANKSLNRVRSKSRPPSMAMLKRLVSRQDSMPSIRYSLASEPEGFQVPEDPPPMTELEFWAALVQDYNSTASRLPTLTAIKVRNGVPEPLRTFVWPSMAGARDKNLDEAYETLVGQPSPYEGIINKDVGRSFPGVELFRDAEGEGQKMLGRVLKCYSLFDTDIGYCQGLGFLVGPLLMNMGEKDAFCVLVRLMNHYALRASFMPDLAGLHMRIYQFSCLLNQHHPELSAHLTSIGVEPAYLSQWFLSCFAVTCPLDLLFRIYDVIFAEGANETVMRVALALFRRNEERMMKSQEFEEVMQLLLGRHLWDVYGHNADELVDDFTSLGGIITYQRLAELEKEFESKDRDAVGQSAGFIPDVQSAASRFLGRLWAPSHGHTPSKGAGATLSPMSAEKDAAAPSAATPTPTTGGGGVFGRGSFLRKSPSKQSISTLNEGSTGSEGSISTLASTAPTDGDIHDHGVRESRSTKAESMRTVSVPASSMHESKIPGIREQQELHTQIEDLLMALSEMQREHAQMVAMLQKEREERGDDQRAVRSLVEKLKPEEVKKQRKAKTMRSSKPPPKRASHAEAGLQKDEVTKMEDKRRTLPARPRSVAKEEETTPEVKEEEDSIPDFDFDGVAVLIEQVQARLDTSNRFSASLETKAQLRSTLARTREQLTAAETSAKDLTERAESAEMSLGTYQSESESLRSEVEELRARVNEEFREKKKLELQVQNMEIQMRMETKAAEKNARVMKLQRAESSGEVPTISKLAGDAVNSLANRRQSIACSPSGSSGLRELKLGGGRRDSAASTTSVRSIRSRRPASPTVLKVESPTETIPMSEVSPVPTQASTPVATPAPVAPTAPSPTPAPKQHTPLTSLSVPTAAALGHLPRKSSLATRAVLATPQHEPVPDEALLLELVNAKTAEAQARQEMDEMKRSIQMQRKRMEEDAARMHAEKRKADEHMFELQAEALNARAEAETSRVREEAAKEMARMARSQVFDSPAGTPGTDGMYGISLSTPGTPGEEQKSLSASVGSSGSGTPVKKEESASSAGGGWFWNRRTASTNKAGPT